MCRAAIPLIRADTTLCRIYDINPSRRPSFEPTESFVGSRRLRCSCWVLSCRAVVQRRLPKHWPGLSVIDGNLYVISGQPQQVYILDAETGVQQGTFAPAGERREPTYWSPVAVGENLAYVGFSDPQSQVHGLYAFDPESRQEQWPTSVKDLILGAPDYADGRVYFGVADGSLYAVDAETGQVQAGWPFEAEEAFWASPLVADGRVYAASMDHHLYCLDAETGDLIWSFEAAGALAAEPILEDGILYFGAL